MGTRTLRLFIVATPVLILLAVAGSAMADIQTPNKAACDQKLLKSCRAGCYQVYNNYIGGNPIPGQVHQHVVELNRCYTQCREKACGTEVPMPCEAGKTKCGDHCVNLNINFKNCGACDAPCKAGQVCRAGLCK